MTWGKARACVFPFTASTLGDGRWTTNGHIMMTRRRALRNLWAPVACCPPPVASRRHSTLVDSLVRSLVVLCPSRLCSRSTLSPSPRHGARQLCRSGWRHGLLRGSPRTRRCSLRSSLPRFGRPSSPARYACVSDTSHLRRLFHSPGLPTQPRVRVWWVVVRERGQWGRLV